MSDDYSEGITPGKLGVAFGVIVLVAFVLLGLIELGNRFF